MDSGDESYHYLISTELLEYVRDWSQFRPDGNQREARYKISDSISQIQLEWKWALKATQNKGKGLHKVFLTAVKDISQEFTPLG